MYMYFQSILCNYVCALVSHFQAQNEVYFQLLTLFRECIHAVHHTLETKVASVDILIVIKLNKKPMESSRLLSLNHERIFLSKILQQMSFALLHNPWRLRHMQPMNNHVLSHVTEPTSRNS